jgi:plastocyanin
LTGVQFDEWLAGKIAAAAATPTPPPSPAPGASGEAGGPGPTLEMTAKGIAYAQTALSAPANTKFQIDFDNEDAGIAHNVSIHEGSATGAEVFKGEIFAGPAKKLYDVPALAAGTYAYVCTVHPSMTGTLTVQ